MTPMASGRGLTDLILRCLVFGIVPFWKVSPWLLMALRIYIKGHAEHTDPLTAFNGRTREDQEYQGTSEYWKFVSPKSLKEKTGLVSISGNAREVCSPMCSRIFTTSRGSEMKVMIHIGSPALAASQGIGFVDFPNPFRPAIAMEECGHF